VRGTKTVHQSCTQHGNLSGKKCSRRSRTLHGRGMQGWKVHGRRVNTEMEAVIVICELRNGRRAEEIRRGRLGSERRRQSNRTTMKGYDVAAGDLRE
jgi:hypothetical protein